jgi:ParB-like chromosome segregation protein Spo0J
MPISKLMEHPENRKLFKDIQETNPAFWLEFLDSIKTFGIIEPLIVNRETMQVRSGNQRLKAALQLGIETVPVLLVDPDVDSDDEIRKMIASNVYRRTIDPFSMFEYIGRLRKPSQEGKKKTKEEVQQAVHKDNTFVSAADIFNALPTEQQAALKEWFNEQADGEKAKTEGQLIAAIRQLESDKEALEVDNLELETELRGVNNERKEVTERIAELEKMIAEREDEIETLRNADYEEEREITEKTINDLLTQQKKLKEKIAELKEAPDINFYLIECVKKQKEINAVLKEIIDNAESLNQSKVKEFQDTLMRTLAIIKKGTEKNNGQNDRRELTSD